jgi:hypothetical protein
MIKKEGLFYLSHGFVSFHEQEEVSEECFGMTSASPSRCFKNVPGGGSVGDPVTFEEAVRKLFALREYPPNDLSIPDDDDVTAFTHFINTEYAEPAFRTKHPETSSVLSRLTADEAKAIMGFTAENPYPLYKWLNAWLMTERQQKVIDHCGPYFVLLYRALEKLDKKTLKASQGI